MERERMMKTAFDILAEQNRPMLVTYLNAMLRDRSLAEDLTQETLMVAYKALDKYEEGRNFGAWLRGIARNRALQNRRADSRRHLVIDSRVVEGMEEIYGAFDGPHPIRSDWDERIEIVRRCAAKLSGRLRDVVNQVYTTGLSLAEAAAALGSTPGAVGQRLSRARKMIFDCAKLQLERENNAGIS
ncbi:MAG: hypothetical protein C0404_03095 [Verrucomicrobia bacterium]|nr:hypothetical protein [Verrucomicrobiota bacterium]